MGAYTVPKYLGYSRMIREGIDTMVRCFLFIVLICYCTFSNLKAVEVTFTAGGILSGVGPDLLSEFSVGDPFEITLTYESDTIDALPEDTEFGIYRNSIVSVVGQIDGYEFGWDPPNPNAVITSAINVDVDRVMDVIIRDSNSGASNFIATPVNGLTPYFGNFPFFEVDGPGGFLGTEDLPTTVPRIDQFTASGFKNFRIQWEPGPTLNKIEGNFDYIFAGTSALDGDFNSNGTIDAADYSIWRDNLGSTTNLDADASGNSLIDQADYVIWASNYGNTSVMLSSNPIPEPRAIVTLLMALLSACHVKRCHPR